MEKLPCLRCIISAWEFPGRDYYLHYLTVYGKRLTTST